MNKKAPIYAKYLLFTTLLISASCSVSAKHQDTFLHCLTNKYKLSHPISDAIYTSKDSSYTSVLESHAKNRRFLTNSTRKPLAIVAAKHESHVQAVVLCAKKHGLQIRIRSGGHDYEGVSYVSDGPFVILDMFNLRSIYINMEDETTLVEAGAWLGELYYKIANMSNVHGFPAGVCPTLGVGGHFSGGGYGNMMRRYGLSVDNVIDAKIVDVRGRVLNRTSMGEDLFWAIRGGGGASFGVILSWKIKLVPVPEKVTVFQVGKTLEDGATDLVLQWQQIAADKLDPKVFLRLQLQAINGTKAGQKTVKVFFIGMFLGRAQELLHLMDGSFPELGLEEKYCYEMRWIESVQFWFGHFGAPITDLLDRTPLPGFYFKRKSDYVRKPISKAGLESIWKVMTQAEDVQMQWNPYGGKMSEIPETATPFPHRAGVLFKVQYSVNWMQDGQKAAIQYLNETKTVYDAMTPFVTNNPREAFLNYRDLDIGSIGSNGNGSFSKASEYGHMYFKGNFERLMKVKTAVDPDNFFRYEQSIPTRNLGQKSLKKSREY